ncbi:hypothetical protein [Agarivorans litoreus]|uniref:hypothetical protein n=1 Tax=Agarivorans litoreus TaxID=1510455 RepID=UPI001C7DF7D2|nr:hypothetical protein [Agarivorans litoreus]
MIDIGIEEKGNCVVASALHLPTNVLKKNSSKTAEKSIAICISDINKEIRDIDWLCCELKDDQVASIDFSGFLKFQTTGINLSVLEAIVDRTLSEPISLHQFTDDERRYFSKTFKRHENTKLFFEELLLIEGAEIENY